MAYNQKRIPITDVLARAIRIKEVKNPATNTGGVCHLPPAPYTDYWLLAEILGGIISLLSLCILVWGLSLLLITSHH